MKRKKSNFIIKTLFGFAIFLVFILILQYFMPNLVHVPFQEYQQTEENQIAVIYEDEIISTQAAIIDSQTYLSINVLKDYIDDSIFWDENENTLTITTNNKVIRMKTEDLLYYVNSKPLDLDFPVYQIDELSYVPTKMLEELYPIKTTYYVTNNILILDFFDKDYYKSTISNKSAKLRYEPDKKSPIAENLYLGDTVYIFNEMSYNNNNYTKVRTESGQIGYILNDKLNDFVKTKATYVPEEVNPPTLPIDKRINIVFDQITNPVANNLESKREYHDGVDVLSPTWFSFQSPNGEIRNLADKDYVDWAHGNGYQVWALLTDNFDSATSHGVISSTQTREYVIQQLLAYTSLYELDGINIDFESVPKGDGEYYVQFMRELTSRMHEQDVIVSVDMFVPKPWTSHYMRGEVGKIVDYVIVMGYDEHYGGSPVSGSVASLSWSEEAIESTLKEGVPKEKLILGIPFYTRVWTETIENGDVKVSSSAYGMNAAKTFMEDKGAEEEWREIFGQNYAEISEDDIVYKCWFEDAESVELRLKLVNEHDIAGVAAWKRGLQTDNIWSLIKDTLN